MRPWLVVCVLLCGVASATPCVGPPADDVDPADYDPQLAFQRSAAPLDSSAFLVGYSQTVSNEIKQQIRVGISNTNGGVAFGSRATIGVSGSDVRGLSLVALDTNTYIALYGVRAIVSPSPSGAPATSPSPSTTPGPRVMQLWTVPVIVSTDGLRTLSLETPALVAASVEFEDKGEARTWEIDKLDTSRVVITYRASAAGFSVIVGVYGSPSILFGPAAAFTAPSITGLTVVALSDTEFVVGGVQTLSARLYYGQISGGGVVTLTWAGANLDLGPSDMIDVVLQGNQVLVATKSPTTGSPANSGSLFLVSNTGAGSSPGLATVASKLSIPEFSGVGGSAFSLSPLLNTRTFALSLSADTGWSYIMVGNTSSNAIQLDLSSVKGAAVMEHVARVPPRAVGLTTARMATTSPQIIGATYHMMARSVSLARDYSGYYSVWEAGQPYPFPTSDPLVTNFTTVTLPPGASFSGTGFSWTPAVGQSGVLQFTSCHTLLPVFSMAITVRAMCSPGQYAAQYFDVCQPCATGYATGMVNTSSATSCMYCVAGTFAQNAITCTPCPALYYSLGGVTNCTSCGVGQVSINGGTSCTSCPAGNDIFNNTCSPCPQGTFATTGALTCTPCPVGTYSSSSGLSQCTACNDPSQCVSAGLAKPGVGVSSTTPVAEPVALDVVNDQTLLAKHNLILGSVAGAIAGTFIVVTILICCEKRGHWLGKVDYFYQADHIVPILPSPVVKRRSPVGGVFSILAAIAIIALLEYFIFFFVTQNVLATDALLPDVSSRSLSVRMRIAVTAIGYDATAGCVVGGASAGVCAMSSIRGSLVDAIPSATRKCAMLSTTSCMTEWEGYGDVTEAKTWAVDWTTGNAWAQAFRVEVNVTNGDYTIYQKPGVAGGMVATVASDRRTLFQNSGTMTSAVRLDRVALYQWEVNNYIKDTSSIGYLVGVPSVVKAAMVNDTEAEIRYSNGVGVSITFEPQTYHRTSTLSTRTTFLSSAGSLLGLAFGVLVAGKFLIMIVEMLIVRQQGRQRSHNDIQKAVAATRGKAMLNSSDDDLSDKDDALDALLKIMDPAAIKRLRALINPEMVTKSSSDDSYSSSNAKSKDASGVSGGSAGSAGSAVGSGSRSRGSMSSVAKSYSKSSNDRPAVSLIDRSNPDRSNPVTERTRSAPATEDS